MEIFSQEITICFQQSEKNPGSHKFKCGGKVETVVTHRLIADNME
jgi:hypothetical protein